MPAAPCVTCKTSLPNAPARLLSSLAMSLINDALKKAQKLRTGDPGTIAPMPGGNTRVTKRGEPRSTQQLVLISSGAIVLVVLSVVATFWFVNRSSDPKPAPKPVAVKPADPASAAPTVVAPPIKPPTVAETPPPKPASPTATAEKPTPAVATRTPTPTPPASTPATTVATVPTVTSTTPDRLVAEPSPSPAPTAPTQTDPRVHAFIDALKVTGIRSSGGDSRVLMNERVFRVNDIVERNLGVRLTKVTADALTFTDSNGAVYVKNF